jgi:hypothetical protein
MPWPAVGTPRHRSSRGRCPRSSTRASSLRSRGGATLNSDQSRRNTRSRIRNHIRNAIIDFDVETTVQFDLDDARERFEEGETLNVAEIGALLATGKVENDELDELAELAEEKGVVESSMSPLQTHYAEEELDMDDVESGSSQLPASVTGTGNLMDFVQRGELLLLLDAYTSAAESDAGDDDAEADAPADDSE